MMKGKIGGILGLLLGLVVGLRIPPLDSGTVALALMGATIGFILEIIIYRLIDLYTSIIATNTLLGVIIDFFDYKKITSTKLLICSVALYASSLYFNAFGSVYTNLNHSYAVASGYEILLIGWMGISISISWFANITYFITLILISNKNDKAIYWAISTLILGLSTLHLFYRDNSRVGLYLGIYLWFISFFCLITLIIIANKRAKATYLPIVTIILGLSTLHLFYRENSRVGLYLGFYLWITSFIFLIISIKLPSIKFLINKHKWSCRK